MPPKSKTRKTGGKETSLKDFAARQSEAGNLSESTVVAPSTV